MIKIDIISGFLGAGKTTLINKLIRDVYAGEKIVLVENEFGDVSVDGGFLSETGVNIAEINSGCICCSLTGDFSAALREVASKYSPDRIIIEPSGVGKLGEVIRAAENARLRDAEINSLVTVVDATRCAMYLKNFGEFFGEQIKSARCIIFSRSERISEQKLDETVSLLKILNPDAVFVTTPVDKLDPKTLGDALRGTDPAADELDALIEEATQAVSGHGHEHGRCHSGECACAHHDHDHHHGHDCSCHEGGHHHDHEHDHDAAEVFTSIGRETVKKFTADGLREILGALADAETYGSVLRAKGIVEGDGGWFHFDYVPGEIDIRRGAAAVTGKFCVIGAGISEDKIDLLFKSAGGKA